MFISFSNGHGSTFEDSLDSGYSFASVPARCRKTTLLEAWKRRRAETLGLLYGTTERSSVQCRWQARFDAHLNRLQGHRRQPIARSGKFVRRAYSRRALDCEKDDGLTCMYAFSCMLSPIVIVEHTSVWEGVGGRGEIWRGIPQSNTKDQLPKPQTATVATAQRPK